MSYNVAPTVHVLQYMSYHPTRYYILTRGQYTTLDTSYSTHKCVLYIAPRVKCDSEVRYYMCEVCRAPTPPSRYHTHTQITCVLVINAPFVYTRGPAHRNLIFTTTLTARVLHAIITIYQRAVTACKARYPIQYSIM